MEESTPVTTPHKDLDTQGESSCVNDSYGDAKRVVNGCEGWV